MRLIPGKTKVKIELFRGITLGDIIVGIVTLALIALVILSTFPGRIYIAVVVGALGGMLIFRLDEVPNYRLLLNFLRYLSYPKFYWRMFSDENLLNKGDEINQREQWSQVFSDTIPVEEKITLGKRLKGLFHIKKKSSSVLESTDAPDDNEQKSSKKKKRPEATEKKQERVGKENDIRDIMPFTGIVDGFIEYDGKYYGTVIEIEPVDFRFFSKYRRNNAIENCVGKLLRSIRSGYSANIVKIERPILYDSYLAKEYDKLDELKASYENGLLTEEELQSRVEIQYDRINEMRKICFEEKIIQPFYYIVLFNSNKKQLNIDTGTALTFLRQAELTARRISRDKEIAIFLKYTNSLDFDERDADRLDPKDYVSWAMPESISFTTRNAVVNKIVTHEMLVVGYPFYVGDSWIAGVMSLPGTKVTVKITPMERSKSIRAIDRSLQELRGQYRTTGIDSKRLEIESHIETLGELLITLQQENEVLHTVNIYITSYDAVRTGELGNVDAIKHTDLPMVADMKKNVRRTWQETGMKLNNMDFAQIEGFIGSQVSAYDPMLKEGRGMPTNTIAGMFPWIYARVSDEGGIRLGSNDGVPVFIDFFRRDSERVNSNMVIIGKSGSGKSYGTKSLLTNMASEDAKIFILDPENEYTELANNLHGKVINVGNAKYGRLNPFQIITTLADDEAGDDSIGGSFSAHLQFLEEFFRQILPDVNKEALEYLNSLVERLYLNFSITAETDLSTLVPEDYPIFDDLYDIVLEDFQRTKNEYLRNILQTLMNYVSKFAGDGRNASIWNGFSSITTDENFTVFNFQSLLANRNSTIANAQMLLILKYLDNEIIKNRDYNVKYGLNRKIVVVIDEAHVFIDTKFPIALDFMFQLAKRIRKYNGMQIVITQNIKDFVGSEEIARKSTAIINACQYSFIFGLSPNDMDDLCKLYEKAGGINEMEQEQILTAPRGMAFTVMSPTSRSSFKIEVPDSMVEMFEKPDYISRYFTGENGKVNWENFVADSRELHDINSADRFVRTEKEVSNDDSSSLITFTELSAEEAAQLTASDADLSGGNTGITFEEITDIVDDASDSADRHVPDEGDVDHGGIRFTEEKVKETPVQPSFPDMSAIIAMVRDEVEREMNKKLQDLAYGAPAVPGKVNENAESMADAENAADISEKDHSIQQDKINEELIDDANDQYTDQEPGSYEKDELYTDEEVDFRADEELYTDEEIESNTDEELYTDEEIDSHADEELYTDEEIDSNADEEPYMDEEIDSRDDDDLHLGDELESENDLIFTDDDISSYSYDDYEEHGLDDEIELYDDDEDDDEDNRGEDEFELKFDIDAILEEQLQSYSEMTISDKMNEIDVQKMEISFNDLTVYIRQQRKSRRN